MAKPVQLSIEEMEQCLIDAGILKKEDLLETKLLSNDTLKHASNKMLFDPNEFSPKSNPTPSKASKKFDPRHVKSNLIPFLNTKEFLTKSVEERVHILNCYHSLMSFYRGKLALKSIVRAPKPKQISTSEENSSPINNECSSQTETYISRSGRHTKRKNYNDRFEEDILEEIDNEFDINLSNTNKIIDVQPSVNKTIAIEDVHVDSLVEKSAQNTYKEKQYTKKAFEPVSLKTKFADNRTKKRFSHTDKIFDKLQETDVKRTNEQRQMKVFENTLPNLDEDENSQNFIPNKSKRQKLNDETTLEIVEKRDRKEDHFEKVDIYFEDISEVNIGETLSKKLPSPRRPIRTCNKKQKETPQPLDIDITPIESAKKTETKSPSRNVRKRINGIETQPSVSRNENDFMDCPICGVNFHNDEIEAHASSCGDNDVPAVPAQQKRITCSVCDKVVGPELYNAHVSSCIASQTEQ